jgi:predicted esterase
MPRKSGAAGFTAHTFEQQLPSCGPITRRYLELVPPGVSPLSSAPVVIVLHDAGEAAESMQARRSRLDFEALARRDGFILVYANAAPGQATSLGVADSGAWQTDRRTHPEIDDEKYLERVLLDLDLRGVTGGSNDVYLAGYGDGAAMALRAAVRSGGRYTGVAAFAPSNLAFFEPAEPRASARLTRVMIALEVPDRGSGEAWRLSLPMFARRWAAALGVEQEVVGRFWTSGTPGKPLGTVYQLDVALPATGSSGVRLYAIDGALDAAPNAVHAWSFLTGVDGADPDALDAPPDLALGDVRDLPAEDALDMPMDVVPDGHSVLREDVEGFVYPNILLDGDVVAPQTAKRRER